MGKLIVSIHSPSFLAFYHRLGQLSLAIRVWSDEVITGGVVVVAVDHLSEPYWGNHYTMSAF